MFPAVALAGSDPWSETVRSDIPIQRGSEMPRSFKLLETLGEGAFGAVHLAEVAGEEGFVQRLAVKWLHPQLSHDAELAGRLRDEARLLGLLNHDHIVRVHGLTRLGGRLAILMEAVVGADLSRLRSGEPVPPRAALEIVECVADALDAAWQTVPPGGDEPLRVVHRDIKPSNVMVTARGGVKVMDFGVARATFDAREAHTRSQQYGTARYMAPERWLEGVADAPSDVFSLGIPLIEIVGGKPVERPRLAKEGYHEDLGRAVEALAPWPAIQDLARRMCAYAPAERPPAADVVRECREMRRSLQGASLREWAPDFVAGHAGHRAGPRDGSVVQEDVSAETFDARFDESLTPTGTAPAPLGSSSGRSGRSGRRDLDDEDDRRRPFLGIPLRHAVAVAAISIGIAALASAGWTWMVGRRDTPPAEARVAAEAPPGAAQAEAIDEPPLEAPLVVEPSVASSGTASPPEPPAEPATTASPEPKVVREPRRGKAAKVEPPPEPPPAPPAEPAAAEQAHLTFKFADPGYTVTANGQSVKSNRGLVFPKGSLVEVRVRAGGREVSCTVTADPGRSRVEIDAKDEANPCRQ